MIPEISITYSGQLLQTRYSTGGTHRLKIYCISNMELSPNLSNEKYKFDEKCVNMCEITVYNITFLYIEGSDHLQKEGIVKKTCLKK